jgi:hypothetical protein
MQEAHRGAKNILETIGLQDVEDEDELVIAARLHIPDVLIPPFLLEVFMASSRNRAARVSQSTSSAIEHRRQIPAQSLSQLVLRGGA